MLWPCLAVFPVTQVAFAPGGPARAAREGPAARWWTAGGAAGPKWCPSPSVRKTHIVSPVRLSSHLSVQSNCEVATAVGCGEGLRLGDEKRSRRPAMMDEQTCSQLPRFADWVQLKKEKKKKAT